MNRINCWTVHYHRAASYDYMLNCDDTTAKNAW